MEDKEIIIVQTIKYNYCKTRIDNLVYEDKHLKKYYLIEIVKDRIKIL